MALVTAAARDPARSIKRLFAERILTPRLSDDEAPRTVAGLKNAHAENAEPEEEDSDDQLNWWQATNVHLISGFIDQDADARESDGMILCDAPGLGKTLSVLATVVNTKRAQAANDKRVVVVFAGRGIVAQWATQVVRHFDADVTNMPVYCAEALRLKYPYAIPISEREPGSKGGVYVDERPTANLPEDSVLLSMDVLLLAKEVLSQNGHDPSKNIAIVKRISRSIRLVVIDESHNLNKRSVSRGELNLSSLTGVPKLLLSGTPGSAGAPSPAELYQMLRLVNHRSLHQLSRRLGEARGGRLDEGSMAPQLQLKDVKCWIGDYFMEKSERVRSDQLEDLVAILKSVFLHTPAVAAPALTSKIVERVSPSPTEVDSYNFALSLHQRDLVRAGKGATQPDEWQRTRPSKDWYAPKKKGTNEPTPPSGQKTVGDLMRAANGGEEWSLELAGCANEGAIPPGIQQAIDFAKAPENADCPTCYKCKLPLPGLLTLPCGCPSEVCPECFQASKCIQFERKLKKFRCPRNCQKRQRPYEEWRPEQPQLVIQTAARSQRAREEQREADAAAKKQRKEDGAVALLRKTVPARPFAPARLPKTLAQISAAEVERRAHVIDAGGKLLYLAQELRELAKQGDAKVYVTPPSNVDVRSRFVSDLCEVIGKEAVADLNVKERAADKGEEIRKFERGHGLYWQCLSCGEDHEQSTLKCTTSTCAVVLEEGDQAGNEVLRYLHDVEKEVGPRDTETIHIGSNVKVFQPSTRTLVGRGKVRALGSCKGKRPVEAKSFHPAPGGSCFVLVLNPENMEGLDQGTCTHMFIFEPILREDKELQAEARGSRLGGHRSLEIIQLLVAGTIEEHQYDELVNIRARRAGKRGGKKFAAECEGEQARMLSELKLLRPDPKERAAAEATRAAAQQAAAEEEVVEDEEHDGAEVDVDEDQEMEVEEEEEMEVVKACEMEPGESDEDVPVASLHVPRRAKVEEASQEVCDARDLLLDIEDAIEMGHVTPSFQKGLRQWRKRARQALTLQEVATLMRELRQSTLDTHRGGVLFPAGWQMDGQQCKQWLEASEADDMDSDTLSELLGQLRDAYSPPPAAAASASVSAASASASVSAAQTQRSPHPTPQPPAQPLPMVTPAVALVGAAAQLTPTTQLASQLSPLINWSKMAGGDKLQLALQWCEEKGADSLEELVEAEMVDVFVDALGLKEVQSELLRKRIRGAA